MDPERPPDITVLKDDHAEAVEFVERNRDIFEHYARGGVKFASAPEGLNTFAFDLKTNTIYINSKFYKEFGFSDEKTTFATFHEIEHFLEKRQLLGENNGEKDFEKYLKRIQKSKAFALMDNCVADIRENRTVVSKTYQDFREIEQRCYKEDLFRETDFTKEPRHIQFVYALLRESRVPDERCIVNPEVRVEIDRLRSIHGKEQKSNVNLFDIVTNPETPMSVRLKLQDKFIWPIVKELLEKDIEDEKKNKERGEKDGTKKSDESESGNNSEGENNAEKDQTNGTNETTPNPDEIFKDAYARADKKVPNATPIEEIKKAFEEWKKENQENSSDKADKDYAEKLGVKKEDLQKYRDLVKSLNSIVNPETQETLVEELRSLFSKIKSKRLKPTLSPRYPMVEGEDLVDPAQLVADVKGGNLEPKVWETSETKENSGKKFGEVEITLIFDRSISMDDDGGQKKIEQQKAGVLGLEALKEFSDICDEERVNIDKPLEVRSEVYSFQSNDDRQDSVPLKKMSKELGEKERVDICGTLSSTAGSTTDYIPLETILNGIDDEMKKKIAEGEVKKIIIVFTDGGSDDKTRVQKVLENLRKIGVVTACIAITESGKPALETYKPDARLAETAERLPLVLGDLLIEHLKDI